MKTWAGILTALTLGLGACGSPEVPPGAAGSQECPEVGGDALIDWVNFVKVDGILYYGDHVPFGTVERSDLGDVHARVKCRVSERVGDPDYELQEGDAGYLEPGTPLYEITGYATDFRLAAKWENKWHIYEAAKNPGATTGGDLIDIEGRVTYIGINSRKDGTTELAAIRDPGEVKRLVEMVSASPLAPDRQPGDDEYDEQVFVEFHLEDGTTVNRSFYPTSRLLQSGVIVPEEFSAAVRAALARS